MQLSTTQEQLSTMHLVFGSQEQLFVVGQLAFLHTSLVLSPPSGVAKPPLSWMASSPFRNSASNFVIKLERVETSVFIWVIVFVG